MTIRQVYIGAHVTLALAVAGLLALCVSIASGSEYCKLDQLPTQRNGRAQIVDILANTKIRDSAKVAQVNAITAKWSLAAITPASFGFFENPQGDNMVAVGAGGVTVTSTDNPFAAGDVGSYIDIAGAGPAGATLRAVITVFNNAGSVTIDTAATTAVVPSKTSTVGHAIWGRFPGAEWTTTPLLSSAGATQLVNLSLNLSGQSFSGVLPIANGGTNSATNTAARVALGPWTDISPMAVFNVKDPAYGAVGNNVADDTVAIQAAVTAAGAAGGGLVYVPRGIYKTTAEIVVPAYVKVCGATNRGTLFRPTHAGWLFAGGALTGGLKYQIAFSDFGVELQHVDGKGIQMRGTCGGVLRDLYIEGVYGSFGTRTNVGVSIIPGDASSFFNTVTNVHCNHMHQAFRLDTGATQGTQNMFYNCDATGDQSAGDTTSVGFYVGASQGQGSVWTGGNFENCRFGVYTEATAWEFTMVGPRFENNAGQFDIYHQSTNTMTVVGGVSLAVARIYLTGTTAPRYLRLVGCYDSSHAPLDFDEMWTAAAPAAGEHNKGQRAWNNAPAAGTPAGWLCTVTGTPGTWVPFGLTETFIGTGSKTFDWPSIAAGAQSTTTVTVTSAALGDYVEVSQGVDLAGMTITGYVSAAGTVTVVMLNHTAGAVDLASSTLKAACHRY